MRIGEWKLSLKLPYKYDFIIHLMVIVLILFGTLMIVSTNLGNVSSDPLVLIKVLFRQSIFIVISYVLLTFLANNFTMLKAKKYHLLIGILLFGFLASTLLFPSQFGSKAWIRIPGISATIQPSEFVKVFMIVAMAVYVEIAGKRNFDFWTIVKIPVFFYIAYAGVIFLQPDIGTLVVITLLCALCFLIPSHYRLRPMQFWMKVAMGIGSCIFLFLMSEQGIQIMSSIPGMKHIAARIENAINPFLNPYSTGYQLINGLYGIANSNFWGNGIAKSSRKFGYLTQADNDFILSVVIEELGIFGLLIIVTCYSILIYRLFYYAFRTKSEGYKIILVGTALYILIHFVLNVGGVGGLIPLTGVPLLFVSSGGSSLMAIMVGIGISQAVISRIRRQGE
ncbi:MAG: FtsW/RodA/SpoVE family cell cycle protein [Erysipelotrichaceae bacterium]|nr:FtsW/RodA/SpoVE family cell cycle protein [Erysipelotrichaceae bacterium]